MPKALERARFERRLERLSPDQNDFLFDEVETVLGQIEAELHRAALTPTRERRTRKVLPAHLERVEEVIEPDDLV